MAKIDRVVFRVQGKYEFPLDMLRYDGCFPQGSQDAAEIRASFHPRETGTLWNSPFTVTLETTRVPTNDRWSSFGWQVVEVIKNGKILSSTNWKKGA